MLRLRTCRHEWSQIVCWPAPTGTVVVEPVVEMYAADRRRRALRWPKRLENQAPYVRSPPHHAYDAGAIVRSHRACSVELGRSTLMRLPPPRTTMFSAVCKRHIALALRRPSASAPTARLALRGRRQ